MGCRAWGCRGRRCLHSRRSTPGWAGTRRNAWTHRSARDRDDEAGLGFVTSRPCVVFSDLFFNRFRFSALAAGLSSPVLATAGLAAVISLQGSRVSASCAVVMLAPAEQHFFRPFAKRKLLPSLRSLLRILLFSFFTRIAAQIFRQVFFHEHPRQLSGPSKPFSFRPSSFLPFLLALPLPPNPDFGAESLSAPFLFQLSHGVHCWSIIAKKAIYFGRRDSSPTRYNLPPGLLRSPRDELRLGSRFFDDLCHGMIRRILLRPPLRCRWLHG